MLLLIIFLVCVFVALGAGIIGAWSDFRGLVIPNIYSLIVCVSFFVAYGLLALFGRDDVFFGLQSHLIAGLVVFVLTAYLFAIHVIGGADSKLASAFAFWMGLKGLMAFLFYVALAGGVLGVAALIIKNMKPFKAPRPGGWVARVQAGENKVPYGIAIAAGALASFAKLGYFSADTLGSFLLS
ncbi:MAG: prepilin peptidase [Alphaproteobacteria bacterium]|nr:prepilin peptidase [Alphaproteobacteria bacterium]